MKQDIRFCTAADGVRLAFATAGSGPPLVRAAHWLTHLELDAESPVWRHWLRDLSRSHTLVRYDLRGCGLSDREVEDVTFEACVSDLEAVVDAAGLRRFALLGPSQGASIAVAYAARHPERVSRLVLYGGYAHGRRRRSSDPGQNAEADVLLDVVRVGWGRENAAFRQVFSTLFLPGGTAEELRSLGELQRQSVSPGVAVAIRSTFDHVDVGELATRVRTPTMVLHAYDDAMVPFDQARQLATRIPGARLVPLDSPNHLLRDGEPAWLRFMEALHEFVDEPAVDADAGEGPGRGARDEPWEARAARICGGSLRLTRRECEVLDGIARGLSNAEVAVRLCISPKTLEKHVTSVFRKLGVSTRAQAIVRGRSVGFGAATARGPG